MMYQTTYKHRDKGGLVVLYPGDAAPSVPVNSFQHGNGEEVEFCLHAINAGQAVYDACVAAGQGHESAAKIAAETLEQMLLALCYVRTDIQGVCEECRAGECCGRCDS